MSDSSGNDSPDLSAEADAARAEQLESWERAAVAWGKRADEVRAFGMPVSEWLIDRLELQPGQELLELAAGPGDTGFLAAELIAPGGTLISSDAAEAMLDVARGRAAAMGIENVRFQRLELEWIDLPTASVDVILCRWGIMLILDPEAAARETRRVLRPGGRIAVAAWDVPDRNLWASIPMRALITYGHVPPPDPAQPGMFALAAPGRLAELLEDAGFAEVTVDAVDVVRPAPDIAAFIAESLEMSGPFRDAMAGLSEAEREAVEAEIATLTEPFTAADGSVRLPGRSLVAVATG
jgi:SAM-dependent methyltransferase